VRRADSAASAGHGALCGLYSIGRTARLPVHKSGSPKLITAAREHSANSQTAFEQKLLTRIAEGESDKEIGRRLDTSTHNVDYHLRKLRKPFGVSKRIELTYLTAKKELI